MKNQVQYPKIIAHRGFWDLKSNIPENSLASLINAQNNTTVYGSEFDVILTSDDVPIVIHDDVFEGCRIEDTPYNVIKNLKLTNGENIPSLDQYLQQGKKVDRVKLILEIKPHQTIEKEKKAVQSVFQLIKKYNLEKQVEYISFSLNICKTLLKSCPVSPIFILGEIEVNSNSSFLTPKEVKKIGLTGISYSDDIYKKHPSLIKEAKKEGLAVSVWTVNSPEDMKYYIEQHVNFITTDYPDRLADFMKDII